MADLDKLYEKALAASEAQAGREKALRLKTKKRFKNNQRVPHVSGETGTIKGFVAQENEWSKAPSIVWRVLTDHGINQLYPEETLSPLPSYAPIRNSSPNRYLSDNQGDRWLIIENSGMLEDPDGERYSRQYVAQKFGPLTEI